MSLFVLSLDYVVPLEAVERHMADHVAWLKRGFADGLLVAAGRKVPRTGGVILATGGRVAVEALAATDPFVVERVATVTIVEVDVSMAAAGLERLKD